jgi:molybdopterin synthase sulfur carrier subunit
MPVEVQIPTPLRPLVGGAAQLSVEARSVGELIEVLGARHAGFKERVLEPTGELRRFVRVFVNDEDVRFLQDRATPLAEGDSVAIVPAIAGGLARASPLQRPGRRPLREPLARDARQEAQGRPGAARVEGQVGAAALRPEVGPGGQAGQVVRLQGDANEGEARRALQPGPLAEREQQGAQDHGGALVLAGESQQQVDAVARRTGRLRRVDQMRHEAERGGEPADAVAGAVADDQRAGELHHLGAPRQRQDQLVEGRARALPHQ